MCLRVVISYWDRWPVCVWWGGMMPGDVMRWILPFKSGWSICRSDTLFTARALLFFNTADTVQLKLCSRLKKKKPGFRGEAFSFSTFNHLLAVWGIFYSTLYQSSHILMNFDQHLNTTSSLCLCVCKHGELCQITNPLSPLHQACLGGDRTSVEVIISRCLGAVHRNLINIQSQLFHPALPSHTAPQRSMSGREGILSPRLPRGQESLHHRN